jgi:hypothetical protein
MVIAKLPEETKRVVPISPLFCKKRFVSALTARSGRWRKYHS